MESRKADTAVLLSHTELLNRLTAEEGPKFRIYGHTRVSDFVDDKEMTL
jgi:hypothetical protein